MVTTDRVELLDAVARRVDRDLLPLLHGLVVVRGGSVVFEHYGTGDDRAWDRPLGRIEFGPATLHDVRSITKSVTALLYGIALERGLVPPPSAPLLAGFPEHADLAGEPARAALTVEHALTMTLGIEWDEDMPYTSPANSEIAMELAPDRYRYILERPVVGPPGATWRYCGGATALLGALIERGAGQPLATFARDELFEPLGIARSEWSTGKDGVASPASGLRLAPRDLAAIGRLVLADGRVGERSVVPAGWLRTALRPHVTIEGPFAYGYQWYLGGFERRSADGRGRVAAIGAMGNGGQRLYIVRELDLVVAITAGAYDRDGQQVLPDAVMAAVVDTLGS